MMITFWLGADHPAYQVARDCLPIRHPPSAHYFRVPDLPAFPQTFWGQLISPFRWRAIRARA